ncbi:MAG: PAS domain-containing protein [Anaerolineae bacterium]|nr:PAS domain-containing protein [Anaerolineae bacterium]
MNEQALGQLQDQFNAITHYFPNGLIALVDRDLLCTFADGEEMASLGLTSAGVIGKPLQTILLPVIYAQLEQALRAVFATGEAQSIEVVWAKHQQVHQVLINPVGDIRPVNSVVVMMQNVTAHKQVEQRLHSRERHYRLLASNLPNIGVMLFDRDLRYNLLEGAILEEVGYTKPIVEGRSLHEVLPPEAVAELEPHYRAALAGEESYFEFHLNRHIYMVRIVPLYEGETITGGMVVIEDVTEARVQEGILRESEEKFRQFAETTDHVFWIFNPKTGRLIYLNPAFEIIWGISRLTIAGSLERWLDTLHPEDRSVLEATIQQAAAGHNQEDVVYRILRPDGDMRWVVTRAFPVRDKQGMVYRVLGIAKDVTLFREVEQERLELVLEKERTHLLSAFIRDTSHELRTPLTIIGSSLYILAKSPDAQKRQQKVEQIEAQIMQMNRLINQMQETLRLEREKTPPFEPIAVNELVENVYKQMVNHLRTKTLYVNTNLTPNLQLVAGNADQLQQAIRNIVENACAFTPEQGAIMLRTYQQEQEIVIRVEDTGIGIHPIDLPHIFEQFYKADGARTNRTSGAGLGLSIARRIIQQHGGRIEVTSELGVGSIFQVFLPVTV